LLKPAGEVFSRGKFFMEGGEFQVCMEIDPTRGQGDFRKMENLFARLGSKGRADFCDDLSVDPQASGPMNLFCGFEQGASADQHSRLLSRELFLLKYFKFWG